MTLDTAHRSKQQIAVFANDKDRTRPKLGKIYDIIINIFGNVALDFEAVYRSFFPALGSRESMDAHARALQLPDIDNESDENLRERLTLATYYMRHLGTRKNFV